VKCRSENGVVNPGICPLAGVGTAFRFKCLPESINPALETSPFCTVPCYPVNNRCQGYQCPEGFTSVISGNLNTCADIGLSDPTELACLCFAIAEEPIAEEQ
jgi:hypothetical protein